MELIAQLVMAASVVPVATVIITVMDTPHIVIQHQRQLLLQQVVAAEVEEVLLEPDVPILIVVMEFARIVLKNRQAVQFTKIHIQFVVKESIGTDIGSVIPVVVLVKQSTVITGKTTLPVFNGEPIIIPIVISVVEMDISIN